MKSFLAILLFILCMPLAGQVSSFDELEFEPDSVTAPYKPSGKNYVLIRSKRGTEGLNKTPSANAILSSEVNEIVLVFSELEASAIGEREEANRERWENLLKTYPELFQFSTTYKNVCQCNTRGDAEAFKKTQGFYVYINGDVPKADEPKAEPAPPTPPAPAEKPKVAKEEKKAEEKKPENVPAPKLDKGPEKQVAVPDRTEVKPKELPPEPVVKAEKHEKESSVSTNESSEETTPAAVVKESPKKKTAAAPAGKPRRAKDPKACRPPCYGAGDEDLNAFFKDNIPLTKKQRKKAKSWMANVRLQIALDGTIKKAMVTGTEEPFNTQVQEILKGMNNWNAAVKNGSTVKSEVRFTLKYDKESKSMRPYEFVINPRPTPKCQCVSDSEMFPD